MDENKTIIGTVTITTEEYRKLIEDNIENEKDASKYRSENWKMENELKKAKEELANANKKLLQYRGFVESSEKTLTEYKLYRIERQEAESTDEE